MNPMAPRRWLILAHAFNMDGRAASQTMTDKIPYLLACGIELVVLSGVGGDQDRRFEHHRLWSLGPSGLRFELRHHLRGRISSPWLYRLCVAMASLLLLPGMLLERLLIPIEGTWSWQFGAILKARRLAKDRPFDLIYSTGGPVAAHLAGRRLRKHLKTPWLAEIHDPLVQPGVTPQSRRARAYARIESHICTDADVAIWFTRQALESARVRNPQLGSRGRMMLPGADNPMDAPQSVYQPGPKLVIGHFGSLSPTRTLMPFMHAWHWIDQHEPDAGRDLELHIYGGSIDEASASLGRQYGLLDRVRRFGRLESDPATGRSGREQVLDRMRRCDVLLLVHGEDAACEEYIPSKVYEYLWMQRPILATVHDNPQMAEILRDQGHFLAETSLRDGKTSADASLPLAAHVVDLWRKWRSVGLPDTGRDSPYTTQASTHQLIEWADELAPRRLPDPQ